MKVTFEIYSYHKWLITIMVIHVQMALVIRGFVICGFNSPLLVYYDQNLLSTYFSKALWTIRCQKSSTSLFAIWIFARFFDKVTPQKNKGHPYVAFVLNKIIFTKWVSFNSLFSLIDVKCGQEIVLNLSQQYIIKNIVTLKCWSQQKVTFILF